MTMTKTILITGATDGIGLETAKTLVETGHTVLLHGRSDEKLAATRESLAALDGAQLIETYNADLSKLSEVEALANNISQRHATLDVLINNAGVFKVPNPVAENGIDVRFVVNTIAPYLLTKRLLPLMKPEGRVVNLSSAAQAPVDLNALSGAVQLNDNEAYAQSKLAITMWSIHMGQMLAEEGPAIIAVNPASLLGSKMVKEAFNMDGNDIRIGADILVRAALSDEFASATGRYFDNDNGCFAPPHADALDVRKNGQLVQALQPYLV